MSNWAKLSASVQQDEPIHSIDVGKLQQARDQRLKIIKHMSNAISCVESMMFNPTLISNGMSDAFVNRMKTVVSTYEKSLPDFVSLSDFVPPHGIHVTIQVKENIGTIMTENGQIALNKHSIVSGNRSDLMHLVQSGAADLIQD